MIAAVVFDIGSVLEVIDDAVFPAPFEQRAGLAAGAVAAASDFAGDPGLGELTEAEVRAHWQARLGLSDEQADELMADYWRWYVGTLDRALVDWFAGVRGRGLKAGILSNSGPGRPRGRAALGLRGDHRRHRLLPRGRAGQARPCRLRADRRAAGGRAAARSSSWTTCRPTSRRPARPAGTPCSTWTPRARSPSWSGSSPTTPLTERVAPGHDADRATLEESRGVLGRGEVGQVRRDQLTCRSSLPGITHGAQSQRSSHARKVWTP